MTTNVWISTTENRCNNYTSNIMSSLRLQILNRLEKLLQESYSFHQVQMLSILLNELNTQKKIFIESYLCELSLSIFDGTSTKAKGIFATDKKCF